MGSRQYLQAMGISLWKSRRNLPFAKQPVQQEEVALDVKEVPQRWEALRQQVANCTVCQLHETRTSTVFGVGNLHADWMIVGEAPGADEDRKGEPFVGKAGQLLNQMLLAIGVSREEVFIANILKCRPPNNRDPGVAEIANCASYLVQQIKLVQPKVILAVGRIAAQNLLDSNETIGRIRGKVHQYEKTATPLVATYHPAYLLRSPREKRKAWADLVLARRVLVSACRHDQ